MWLMLELHGTEARTAGVKRGGHKVRFCLIPALRSAMNTEVTCQLHVSLISATADRRGRQRWLFNSYW